MTISAGCADIRARVVLIYERVRTSCVSHMLGGLVKQDTRAGGRQAYCGRG